MKAASIILFFILMIKSVTIPSYASSNNTHSLQSLITVLDKSSFELQQKRLDVEAAAGQRLQAGWRLGPELSYSVGKSHLAYSGSEFVSQPRSDAISQVLSARWRIFDGLGSLRGLEVANVEQIIADLEYANVRFELIAQLSRTYVRWQSSYARKVFLEQVRELREKSYRDVETRAKAGEIDLQERVLFENQFRESSESLLQAQEELGALSLQLNRIIGKKVLEPEVDRPSLSQFEISIECESREVEVHTQLAATKRSLLETRVDINELRLKDNRWSYAPQVDIRADYSMGEELFRTDATQNLRILLQLNWELFSGRRGHFEKTQLLRNRKRMELELDQLTLTSESQDVEYCRRIQAIEQRHKQLQSVVENNRRLLQFAEEKYRLGEISALDLVSYQTSLVTSEISLIGLNQTRQLNAIELKLLREML